MTRKAIVVTRGRAPVGLSLALLIAAAPLPAFGQAAELGQFRARQLSAFDTEGHVKSEGLRVTLRYPASWSAEEGERPHVVQKFFAPDRRIGCMLLISDTGRNRTPAQARAALAPANLRNLLPGNATYLGSAPTTLDGLPAAEVTFSASASRAGMELHMRSVAYVVFYGRKEIDVMCSVGGTAAAGLDSWLSSYLPVFRQIANSLVLHDQYRR